MKQPLSMTVALAGYLIMESAAVIAGKFDARIPMSLGTSTTYYVQGRFGGLEATDFMVDTGSGFLTINKPTLDELLERGLATYKRDLPGVLADGTEIEVPVYQVAQFSIGPCLLQNVEAAVFPSTKRQIIGLNVLNRSAPFIFSVNPPELVLSHCTEEGLAEAEVSSLAN
jgi:predicted aspartyl protease